jgi:hypothetical protein
MLAAFTIFHVVLSLIGIGSGLVVVYGLLTANRMDGWTALFLATTLATSLTGFLFPVHKLLPSHVVGILSVIILGLAYLARYRFRLSGAWRATYVITAVIALYLNCFVAVVQSFKHIPALAMHAPTQTEPPFKVVQLVVLVLFLCLGVFSVKKFRVAAIPHM